MDRAIRKILLVDGSAAILVYLEMLLKRLEYKVQTARSAQEALGRLEEDLPSIVLTETALPDLSGISLLKRIKEQSRLKTIPVIMLTSENDPATQDACRRLGCSAYLVKPVEPDLLYRTIQTVSESAPRTHIRLNTSLKVLVGDDSILGGAARTEYATALSEGGMYVRTLYPQPLNAVIPVRIYLQNTQIRAKATVLYTFGQPSGPFNEPGMGMKFVEISETDREAIRRYIKEQLTRDVPLPEA